jgi:4-diphosphocytidyl-2-C-methyl-D-erythritol kinase
MWVHHGVTGIEVRAPAKLNLHFEVIGRRDDGFHEIETLMAPVNLYDSLMFRVAPPPEAGEAPVSLHCCWASHQSRPELPQDGKNLVVRAADLLRLRAGVESGASIRLVKRIPVQSGLGGGSSDAAATLLAANIGWGLGWSREQVSAVAAEVGSDVPFFLHGGPAICQGRGERVTPVGPLGALHAVVAQPPQGLSTAAVYGRCRPAAAPKKSNSMCEALRTGSLRQAAAHMHNGLQRAAAELSPWIDRLADEFRRLDCPAHQLTGSGSCYFGLFPTAAAARRAGRKLVARNVGAVYVVQGVGRECGLAL